MKCVYNFKDICDELDCSPKCNPNNKMTREEYEASMLFTDNDIPIERVFSNESIKRIEKLLEDDLK